MPAGTGGPSGVRRWDCGENGVSVYPVHEITIAGNLKEMYRNIAALGNDVDLRGGVRVGSVLISEMTIAGE